MNLVVEQTEDGSNTLYLPDMDEHYHSVKGALTESQHIFINMGLKSVSTSSPSVLEIGFGTGLNAYLTLLSAEEMDIFVDYTTLELYPLDLFIIQKLDYSKIISPHKISLFYQLHAVDWEKPHQLTDYFQIHKLEKDFTQFYREENQYDVIYFDAFAPEKQPEMWTDTLFQQLYNSLKPGGILTTYCSKGVIRRMLQATGFEVERLPGPPGGKREILRASKKI